MLNINQLLVKFSLSFSRAFFFDNIFLTHLTWSLKKSVKTKNHLFFSKYFLDWISIDQGCKIHGSILTALRIRHMEFFSFNWEQFLLWKSFLLNFLRERCPASSIRIQHAPSWPLLAVPMSGNLLWSIPF